MDWEKILSNYGWPTLILSLIVLFFYIKIWPEIVKHLDEQRKAATEARESQQKIADAAREALTRRADKLEEREDTVLSSFKDVLEASAERNQKQLEVLGEIASLVRDNNNRLKRISPP